MSAYDFSKLKYDISKVPTNEFVVDHFPELADYHEFSDKKEDALLRWVILAVDDGSPFFVHRDFEERSKAVYKYLKLDIPQLSEYISGDLMFMNSKLNVENKNFRIKISSKIFKFFIVLDKSAYMTWYSLWFSFQENNAFLQIPLDPEDNKYEDKMEKKGKIRSKLPEDQKQLSDFEKQIFGDSGIKSIVTKQSAKSINFPERMAKMDDEV